MVPQLFKQLLWFTVPSVLFVLLWRYYRVLNEPDHLLRSAELFEYIYARNWLVVLQFVFHLLILVGALLLYSLLCTGPSVLRIPFSSLAGAVGMRMTLQSLIWLITAEHYLSDVIVVRSYKFIVLLVLGIPLATQHARFERLLASGTPSTQALLASGIVRPTLALILSAVGVCCMNLELLTPLMMFTKVFTLIHATEAIRVLLKAIAATRWIIDEPVQLMLFNGIAHLVQGIISLAIYIHYYKPEITFSLSYETFYHVAVIVTLSIDMLRSFFTSISSYSLISDARDAPEATPEECTDPCPVCFEEMTPGPETRVLPCGHAMHMICLSNWMIRQSICPVCRAELSGEGIQAFAKARSEAAEAAEAAAAVPAPEHEHEPEHDHHKHHRACKTYHPYNPPGPCRPGPARPAARRQLGSTLVLPKPMKVDENTTIWFLPVPVPNNASMQELCEAYKLAGHTAAAGVRRAHRDEVYGQCTIADIAAGRVLLNQDPQARPPPRPLRHRVKRKVKRENEVENEEKVNETEVQVSATPYADEIRERLMMLRSQLSPVLREMRETEETEERQNEEEEQEADPVLEENVEVNEVAAPAPAPAPELDPETMRALLREARLRARAAEQGR